MLKKGVFISLEGIEGAGKSSVAEELKKKLMKKGFKVLVTREPGGEKTAEEIRDVILNNNVHPTTELLLFIASRVEHLKHKILPALQNGYIVIVDRYKHSTYAYQGYGRGLDLDYIKKINEFGTMNINPDLTFYLDISLEESKRRKAKVENINRLDKENDEFFIKVISGYEEMISNNEMIRIDGEKDIEKVSNEIYSYVLQKIKGI